MNTEQAKRLLDELTAAIRSAEYARAVNPLGVEAGLTQRVQKAEEKVREALCRESIS